MMKIFIEKRKKKMAYKILKTSVNHVFATDEKTGGAKRGAL